MASKQPKLVRSDRHLHHNKIPIKLRAVESGVETGNRQRGGDGSVYRNT